MSAALIFGLLFALMLTGMPVSISLGLTVLTFLFTMTEVPIESVGLKLFSGLDNFGIMAIPFFILAGAFLTRGGVARRMIAFTTSLVGHLPGGLGLAGVAACAMFAAISGSSVATVVAIGSIMMPAMVRSEEHTSELQSHVNLVCRLLLEKKKKTKDMTVNKPHTQYTHLLSIPLDRQFCPVDDLAHSPSYYHSLCHTASLQSSPSISATTC